MVRNLNRSAVLLVGVVLWALLVPASILAAPVARQSVIVVFRESVRDATPLANQLARQHGFALAHVYEHAVNGFAAELPSAAITALRRNPNVAFVEADGVAYADVERTGATWGLDRIDDRDLPLDGTYTYSTDGAGVTAYILDTGIRTTHTQFDGRARMGYDAVGGSNANGDCHGHGTHVAGTVGGETYGVAPAVNLVAVRVLGCTGSGSWSGIIAGIDWVTADARRSSVGAAVANMSLSGGAYSSVDTAVRNSVASGVTYAIAAGNNNTNACNYSPARTAEALTIGSTDRYDVRSSFSNYGTCVDLFAPGSSIASAYHTSDTAWSTMSGTSMAAPHVAGVAALFLGQNAAATPTQVRDAIYAATTKGKVSNSNSTNNHLLYSVAAEANAVRPVASFTASCDNLTLTCSFTDGSTDADGTVTGWQWSFGDGTTMVFQEPPAHTSHTYAAGSYSVSLTVTDDSGLTHTTTKAVAVTGPTDPVASFTSNCSGLTCSFTDRSSDGDGGSIRAWNWTFDDGTTSDVQSPSRTYGAAGTYPVSLTVTDDEGVSSSTTASVSPTAFTLTYSTWLQNRRHRVDLRWSGATGTYVDVYRNGSRVTYTANDGFYTDRLDRRGSATYTYRLCVRPSTTNCSNTVQVIFP